jgi:hypothetical protein
MEETMAVHMPPPTSTRSASGRGGLRAARLPRWPWLVGLLVVAMAVGAALLPGATVRISPATSAVTPQDLPIVTDVTGRVTEELHASKPGTATGVRPEQIPARGVVTFFNWNTVAVEVPQGTHVSVAGSAAFVTLERIVVPRGRFGAPITPGEKSVEVAAVVAGEAGNVAAGAIDTIDDPSVREFLRGFPENPNRLVGNADPTTGGLETSHPVIQQSDVDAAIAAIQADLQQQLSDALGGEPDRIYAAAPDTEVPSVDVPPGLVGTEDTPTFELTGTLSVDRPYGSRADVEATARSAMLSLGGVAPPNTAIVADSITVVTHDAIVNGSQLEVPVTVTAAAAAEIDEAQVRDRIAGMTVAEARTELDSLGEIAVDLWPPWVDRLPLLTFRIEITQEVQAPDESPPASATQTLSQ